MQIVGCLKQRKVWLIYGALILTAFGFRLFVALRLPNDDPDDGRVYAQIARNVLEQHVYSHESESPYVPSLIRLPGYPLFLAAVYSVSGHGNNRAVRIAQAAIDTGTCALIALVAFLWVPDKKRRHFASIGALILAALCPFTTIYVATILTEVPTNFFAVGMVLSATLAFKAAGRTRVLILWAISGLLAGIAVLFRPDSGLFAAALGITLLVSAIASANETQTLLRRMFRVVPLGLVFSIAFCLVLVPWTIRNRRVFHLFQPLSPMHGEMPGEFVPRGYLLWLRTWLDDGRYVGPVLWKLDTGRIDIDDFPDAAFDSDQERDRVAALLDRYNHPPDEPESESSPETKAATQPQTTVTPESRSSEKPSPPEEDENEQDGEAQEDEQQTGPEEVNVEMTPEIDAGFAQLGRERVSHAPIRYYFVLPMKRAAFLWFDTHSQYYPFEGDLFPLEDLDYETHQQLWLPLFAGLTWLYTMLGVIGGWVLWRSRDRDPRRWLLLAGLIIFLRLGFFATLENPEPRYTVEIFPFLCILSGIAFSRLPLLRRTPRFDQ
jgi:4-amino-4-deoxy-L-arabinose transferase-like glycosyltransferase